MIQGFRERVVGIGVAQRTLNEHNSFANDKILSERDPVLLMEDAKSQSAGY